MSSAGTVTGWIADLKAGDEQAAQRLWERYFTRLVRLVRTKLRDTPRRAADEEDVALSAFDSFCRGAEQGRFPRLHDRDDLWQLLVMIGERKAADLRERERAAKRGGGRVRGESGFQDGSGDPLEGAALDALPSPEPTPELAAQLAEDYRRLLDLLADEQLRSIAVWKMEGYTNEEIAARLDCVVRTVERRLWVIRRLWLEEIP
jgi:DNA-directed RNA polymerase specialized sigma24 family protein